MKSWVKTRGVQFLWLPIPASSAVPFFLLILHARWWTLFLAIAVSIFMIVMRVKGRTVPWLFRRLKTRLAGGVVSSRPVWYRRRMQRREGFDLLNLEDVEKV